MTQAQIERIEELQTEIRTFQQLLKQTDADAMAASDGWNTDVTDKRDEWREGIASAEEELAELEGREYTAPEKVHDSDRVRVGDSEDAIADLSDLASETDANLSDVLDALAELSADVSALYDSAEGGE